MDLSDDLTEDLSVCPFPDSFSSMNEKTSPRKFENSKPIDIAIEPVGLEDSLELMVKASPGSDLEENAHLIKTPGL